MSNSALNINLFSSLTILFFHPVFLAFIKIEICSNVFFSWWTGEQVWYLRITWYCFESAQHLSYR